MDARSGGKAEREKLTYDKRPSAYVATAMLATITTILLIVTTVDAFRKKRDSRILLPYYPVTDNGRVTIGHYSLESYSCQQLPTWITHFPAVRALHACSVGRAARWVGVVASVPAGVVACVAWVVVGMRSRTALKHKDSMATHSTSESLNELESSVPPGLSENDDQAVEKSSDVRHEKHSGEVYEKHGTGVLEADSRLCYELPAGLEDRAVATP